MPPGLAALYGGELAFETPDERPSVLANFVSTLDGVISYTLPGRSGGGEISGNNLADAFVMGLLRALADLTATERTMYELDNRKDQVMTVLKLALANLAMWAREHYFPATYAHATWARLAPFFHLAGVVQSGQGTVSVALRPFNDRHYTRDLVTLCQRVNAAQCHLPDGRVLRVFVQNLACPRLPGQERQLASRPVQSLPFLDHRGCASVS